jgi:hypothetical protein
LLATATKVDIGQINSSVLTPNALIKAGTTPASSSIIDNGTTVTTTEPVLTGNTATLAGLGTVTSTSFVTFTTNTLVLPTVPISTRRRGYCDIIFQVAATSTTPTFAFNTNNTLTDFTVLGSQYNQSTSVVTNFLPTTGITVATQIPFTAALTVPASTSYRQVHADFIVTTNGTNTEQVTIYAKVNSGTLTVITGSGCSYL